MKAEINHHRYLYHVWDKEEISAAALDSLKNELFKLELDFPDLIAPDSPTQRVGGRPLERFKKVAHSSPMISLFDAFSEQDMKDWEERLAKLVPGEKLDYYAELKMDGLAMSLVYEKGTFTVGATRGDGQIGEDVSQNLKTIEAIPLKLRLPSEEELDRLGLDEEQKINVLMALKGGRLEVRGEAIMTRKTFAELNEKLKQEGKPLLANPRNAAAGSIRQLDPQVTASRRLDFYVYSVATDLGLSRHEEEHELAKLLGFKVLKHNKYAKDLKEIFAFHDFWEAHREEVPFECDGIVVVIDDLRLWPRLGTVGKGPRFMMAYKFAAEQATTKVEEVVWQVGRTGVLTPAAALTPVRVGGVTIRNATLHNLDEIRRLGLKVGDTVIIERAGDVIPKVVKVLPGLRNGSEREIEAPDRCPICESEVAKVEGEVAYRCTNKNCYAISLRGLIHWASKGALDIEGLGPKIIEQLVKQNLVRDLSDFYALTVDDLKPLERFAERSAEKLVASIESRKQPELGRLIYGLGIRHVGEETAIDLAQRIAQGLKARKGASLDEIMDIMGRLKREDLEAMPDIGPVVARSIYEWFHNSHNLNILKRLEKNGVSVRLPAAAKNAPAAKKLAGKTFVLTGGLESLTRDQAKDKIRELGGKVSSQVSKNTDYVIAGSEPGSKFDKAKDLGVKIIDEGEFLKLIKS